MSNHEAAESRPTIEPSIQCSFVHLRSIHESEATDKLIDAWDELEEFLLAIQEILRLVRVQPTSARSLSAAKYNPVEIGAPVSASPCNAAFNCGSSKSIGSNP